MLWADFARNTERLDKRPVVRRVDKLVPSAICMPLAHTGTVLRPARRTDALTRTLANALTGCSSVRRLVILESLSLPPMCFPHPPLKALSCPGRLRPLDADNGKVNQAGKRGGDPDKSTSDNERTQVI